MKIQKIFPLYQNIYKLHYFMVFENPVLKNMNFHFTTTPWHSRYISHRVDLKNKNCFTKNNTIFTAVSTSMYLPLFFIMIFFFSFSSPQFLQTSSSRFHTFSWWLICCGRIWSLLSINCWNSRINKIQHYLNGSQQKWQQHLPLQ